MILLKSLAALRGIRWRRILFPLNPLKQFTIINALKKTRLHRHRTLTDSGGYKMKNDKPLF